MKTREEERLIAIAETIREAYFDKIDPKLNTEELLLEESKKRELFNLTNEELKNVIDIVQDCLWYCDMEYDDLEQVKEDLKKLGYEIEILKNDFKIIKQPSNSYKEIFKKLLTYF